MAENVPDLEDPMAHATHRSRMMPPGHARRAGRQTVATILMVLAVLAAIAFAWLAHEVVSQALVGPNTTFELGVHAQATPALDSLFAILTHIGSVVTIAALTLIIGGLMFMKGRREDAMMLAGTMVGAVGITEVLKHTFHQTRPALFATAVHETGFSFPSGHSTLSFCLFGFLALWLVLEAPRHVMSWIAAVACVGLAALIALSRVYLGVHWPTDVLAGMLVALAWVSFVTALRQAFFPPLEA